MVPGQLAEVAERFGEIEVHPAYPTLTDAPRVQVLESTPAAPSKIEEWHTDMTFRSDPPIVTVLYGKVVPEFGGDTVWASTVAAYEGLSPPLRALVDGLTAVHDFRHGFRESLAEPGGEARLAAAVAANPPVTHPVVFTHPLSARRALYVNPLFTTHICELSKLESAGLLQTLYRHMFQEQFTVRLRWQQRTVAIWDNRITQHKPVNDFHGQHRQLYRVTVAGGVLSPQAI